MQFSLDDLKSLMVEAAGDTGELDGDILDTGFTDLGYDSLSLLEASARVQRTYGVSISDDAVGLLVTPRDFLELVNSQLSTPAAA